MPPLSSARLRTLLRTSRVTGPLLTWLWSHYITALCTGSPDDCADIPKVPGAGRVVRDPAGLDPAYQLMHNGVRVHVGTFCGDFTTRLAERLRGHHEPQQERVFHDVLQGLPPDMTMLEIGANWAYYSLWAKHARPAARTILVEPVDDHLAAGRDNFELNGVEGEFVRAFVAAESSAPRSVRIEGRRLRDVPGLSVDDALGRFGVTFLHVLHADIQGDELALLRGARETLRTGRVGYVFLSTHGTRLHRRCLRFLRRRGCVIVAEHTKRESFSPDGLIVARHVSFPGLDHVEISKNGLANELRALWRAARAGLPRPPWAAEPSIAPGLTARS